MRKSKFLSLLLVVSMLLGLMIATQTVSAANPWKIVMNKDFSTADQLAIGGVKGGTAGFIDSTGGFVYDEANACLKKTNATKWEISLGKNYSAPNKVRYSFDVKLDDSANYYIDVMSAAWDQSSVAFAFDKNFGGETFRRNEWQKYTLEFTPSATAAQQKVKLWRGDASYYDSAKEVTYSYANNRTAVTWLRFQQKAAPTTEVLFDNFKIEQFMFLPEVKAVSFIDNLGNEITDFEDMTPAVAQVKVILENAASVDAILENFWIFNETRQTEVTLGDATYVGNVFTANLPNGLQGGCVYSINVDPALANANGEMGDGAYITFNTAYAHMQAELKVSATDTYAADKWKTVYSRDYFDTSLVDGNYATVAKNKNPDVPGMFYGIVKIDRQTYVDYLKLEDGAYFYFTYGGVTKDAIRYSFDINLDGTANYTIQPYGYDTSYQARNQGNTADINFPLSGFGGEAATYGSYQRYNIEIIPDITNGTKHMIKMWRGDEADYANATTGYFRFTAAHPYITFFKFYQTKAPSGEVYMDNFKMEKQRYIFNCDFSEASYAVDPSNATFAPSREAGFAALEGTITNAQRFEVDAANSNTEFMKVWLAGLYTNAAPVKFSFDLKTDNGNLINLLIRFGAQTSDVSGTYVVNGDENVGGATFHPGAWQRYNFIITPPATAGANHTITAWRGGESDRATAVTTTFVMPSNRTNVSNISLINGVAADTTYYIDNVVAERFFDDGFEVTNPQINRVTATIDNAEGLTGDYWLLLAGYENGALTKIEPKDLTLKSFNSLLQESLNVPSDMAGCDQIKAFLWDKTTLEPLTGFIELR